MKKSFALLTMVILLVAVSFLSISIVEVNLLSSNLNRIKYLHLQATIHLDTINKYVQEHSIVEIEEFQDNWNDVLFEVTITPDENNSSIYYTSIQTIDNSPIRLSQKIIK